MNFAEIKDLLFNWQQKRGVEALELYLFRENGLKITRKDRKLETFQPYQEEGLAVRVIERGSLGFSYSTAFSADDIEETAEKALEMALNMPSEGVSFPSPEEYPGLSPVQRELLTPEEALRRLEELEDAAFGFDGRVKRIQEAGLRDTRGEIFLANTNGIEASWQYRSSSLVAVVIAMAEKEAQMGWEWRAALLPEEVSPEEVGRNAARRAVLRLGARPAASRRLPVLLPPEVAVDFLELIAEALSGDNVLKGKSVLSGKLGQKVFSPLVNLTDNGVLVDALGTRPFDDEGSPQNETILAREGVLENFLFNYYWGQKAGQKSTGNARRPNFKNPPEIGLTNFYLAPGEHPREELLSSHPEVFEVLEVLGMHTADPYSGDFSVGVSGLLHSGEGFTPLSGMALSGNVFELFQRIEALGNDLTFYGNIGAPSILIEELDLAGS